MQRKLIEWRPPTPANFETHSGSGMKIEIEGGRTVTGSHHPLDWGWPHKPPPPPTPPPKHKFDFHSPVEMGFKIEEEGVVDGSHHPPFHRSHRPSPPKVNFHPSFFLIIFFHPCSLAMFACVFFFLLRASLSLSLSLRFHCRFNLINNF